MFACSLSLPRCGPRGKATDEELIALAVAQAVTGLVSDRQFLGTIGRLLPGCFPRLPGQSQFNRRLRRLTPQITRVQLGLAELIAAGRVRLVDGTLLSCANYAGCAARNLLLRGLQPGATANAAGGAVSGVRQRAQDRVLRPRSLGLRDVTTRASPR